MNTRSVMYACGGFAGVYLSANVIQNNVTMNAPASSTRVRSIATLPIAFGLVAVAFMFGGKTAGIAAGAGALAAYGLLKG